jgi:Glycosyltransferase
VGKLVERLAARMPDGVIAVSERTAADLVALGIRKERITVVPNGIPLEHIRSIPPSIEACDVIFVGRLIKDKHVDVLLRACAGMPWKVTIIGDGPERAGLEAMAADLKVPALFTGFLAEDELIARMKAAKVFVLPSTREGFGITVVEAMACGVPVITVDAPRNYAKELVKDGVTGRVVTLDEKSIKMAISDLFIGEGIQKMRSEACLKNAERYDLDKILNELGWVYAGMDR